MNHPKDQEPTSALESEVVPQTVSVTSMQAVIAQPGSIIFWLVLVHLVLFYTKSGTVSK